MDTLALFRLEGKVAVVTGGSRGLGKAMAEGLAEAGARVVISARREEWLRPTAEEFAARGLPCLAVRTDVTQPDQVQALVEQTVAHFGGLHVLINNAGISWGAPAEEMPLERWRQVLEVNATGTFLVSQAAGRVMMASGGGTIINIASLAGLAGSAPEVLSAVGYSASKGAVIALTRDLAVKWARHRITVNAIAPGFFPTRMTDAVLRRAEAEILAGVPLGRLGSPDDIKGLAVFLASPAAAYLTGQVIALDGGATAW